jgi:shikimate kinase
VKKDKNRPLLQGGAEERVHTLLKEREGLYDFAPIQLATDGKKINEILKELWSHPDFKSQLS